MPFSRSKNDWTFFGKIWTSIAVSLLSTDLSPKSTILFSNCEEYFNSGLCEKKDLAASLGVSKLSSPSCSSPSGAIGKLRLLPQSMLYSEPLKYQVIKSNSILCLTAQAFLHSIKNFLMLKFSSNCIDFFSGTWGFAVVDYSLKCYRLVLSRDIRRVEKDELLLQAGTENPPKILLGASSSHLKPPWLQYMCSGQSRVWFCSLLCMCCFPSLSFQGQGSKPDHWDNWEHHTLFIGGTLSCSALCETHKLVWRPSILAIRKCLDFAESLWMKFYDL